MKPDESARLLRVGVAVTIGLCALVAVVLLLGKSRSLFSSKAVLHTAFENTSGLVVGAPVRLAGVDIGVVQALRFDRDLRVKKVHVVLGVQSRYLERIRQDSVAHLSSKGLLGDMLINITVGSDNEPQLKSGDHLRAQESEGLTEVVETVHAALTTVQGLAGALEKRLDVVLSDQVARDFERTMHASADLVEKIERGDGLLHALIYRPQLARDSAVLLAEAQASATRLNQSLARVDRVLAVLETGRGALHELVYDPKGQVLLTDLSAAVRDIAQVVAEVRSGDGVLHELLYKTDDGQLMKDLTASARIVRGLAEETQQGKGTIGGLLKDPTIYEDLKTTLGGVARSRLLRAVVRYAIQHDALKVGEGGK